MSETLHFTQVDTWDNPRHIAHIIKSVKEQVEARRFTQLHGFTPTRHTKHGEMARRFNGWEAENTGYAKVKDMASKFKDKYIRDGMPILYQSWEDIGDYLLTPPTDRHPIEAKAWVEFQGFAGAVCLASRAAETPLILL